MFYVNTPYTGILEYYEFVFVNGHRKQQVSYTENQQTLFLFLVFIDARLTYNSQKTRVSSQVLNVPPSRSGDAGIGTEDQHRFIVPERSPAPHDGPILRPRRYIQSKEVTKIPTFLLRVPGHGPYGYTWLGHDNLQFTKYSLQTT